MAIYWAVLSLAGLMLVATMPVEPALEVKVMTYNLRYATAPDGANAWPKRKKALLDLIKRHDPDILGVQEALAEQIDLLRKELPGHEAVGVGRDDGIRKGEHSTLFFRRDKFGLRQGGTKWISGTPDLPGSKGPGANLPRVFSWAILTTSAGPTILVMNAHFDHQSEEARVLGAVQMRSMTVQNDDLPALMLGDFNCTPDSAPMASFLSGGVFSAARPKTGPYVTFNGFKADITEGDMIDHVLADQRWEILDATIDRTSRKGRVPSDHFPLVVNLRLRK